HSSVTMGITANFCAAILFTAVLAATSVHGTCPGEFVQIGAAGCCYYFSSDHHNVPTLTKAASQQFCQHISTTNSMNIDLYELSIGSPCGNYQELTAALYTRGRHTWLGANYNATGESWVWQNSGKKLAPTSILWKSGFPKDGTGEDCLATDGGIPRRPYVYNLVCMYQLNFVCQIFNILSK
ncbi:unnamed protein product, partial [Meganyctiphanes norvegica]